MEENKNSEDFENNSNLKNSQKIKSNKPKTIFSFLCGVFVTRYNCSWLFVRA